MDTPFPVTLFRESKTSSTVRAEFECQGQRQVLEIDLWNLVTPADSEESIRQKIEQWCRERYDRIVHREAYLEKALQTTFTIRIDAHEVRVKMTHLDNRIIRWKYFWQREWHRTYCRLGGEQLLDLLGPNGLSEAGLQLVQAGTADSLDQNDPGYVAVRQRIEAFMANLPVKDDPLKGLFGRALKVKTLYVS
jgi:predicted metalloprotease